MKAFDKPALIRLRLENARETLDAAPTLYKNDSSPISIVNRAYYPMFYAALALLVTVDRHATKHTGVIGLFDKEFVRQNIVTKELGKMLHEAFEARQEGDYQDFSKIDRKVVSEILESANIFVKAIEEKLSNQP